MSDLYRIHVGEEWLYEGGPEDVLQSLKDDGVLVPATVDDLDIEAAFRVSQTLGMLLDRLDVQWIVRAALGGTNES